MKKTAITLLVFATFSASADYEQAHDPHVINPLGQICKIGTGTIEPTKPDTGETNPPVEPGELVNPDGYYTAAMSLSGAELKASLNTIISEPHIKLAYTDHGSTNPETDMDVWKALKYTDQDPNNSDNVILLYSGRSQHQNSYTSSKTLPPGVEAPAYADTWNREHVWAKSQAGFPDQGPYGYTDIHHLRPTDQSLNSERNNREFLEGGDPTNESPEAGNRKSSGSGSDTFEPRDEVKGDVARMLFYMATRYEGSDPKTPDLELAVGTESGASKIGDLCTLLRWNKQDPVDEFEAKRNNRIHEIQKNRNPYIDNPQWVDSVYDNGECN